MARTDPTSAVPADVRDAATRLIAALDAKGLHAALLDLAPAPAVGVNVFAPTGQLPAATVVVSARDYAWGASFEHTEPARTRVSSVVAALLQTVPQLAA